MVKTGRCSRGTDSLTLCFLLRPDVGDVNISDDRTWAPTRVLTLTEVGDGDPGYIAVALLGAAGCCLLLAACFFCRIFQARFPGEKHTEEAPKGFFRPDAWAAKRSSNPVDRAWWTSIPGVRGTPSFPGETTVTGLMTTRIRGTFLVDDQSDPKHQIFLAHLSEFREDVVMCCGQNYQGPPPLQGLRDVHEPPLSGRPTTIGHFSGKDRGTTGAPRRSSWAPAEGFVATCVPPRRPQSS